MRTVFHLLIVAGLLCAAGCATPYGPAGLMGGYSNGPRLDALCYWVTFSGNAFTSRARAKDFAMLRAAELCMEMGYNYFRLEDVAYTEEITASTTPASSTTTGSGRISGGRFGYSAHTTYTPATTHYTRKPLAGVVIRCVPRESVAQATPDQIFYTVGSPQERQQIPENSTFIFDAESLRNWVRARYGIKDG
jgi:hypothetical protein